MGRTLPIDRDRREARSRGEALVGAAIGALAVGAGAIGALAIGRLAVRKARIGSLEIGELHVARLRRGALDEAQTPGSTKVEPPTVALAHEYVALCRQGEFEEAMDRLFSPAHVRIESRNMLEPPAEIRGLAAVKENSRGFAGQRRIYRVDVGGPLLGDGAQFAVRFAIEAVSKTTGERVTIRKLDLYTVHDGQIVRSEVYYNTPPLPAS